MKHKTRAKALSWLLSLAMALSLLPGLSIPAQAVFSVGYRKATVNEETHAVSFTDETCTEYTPVTTDTTAWSNGWYVVSSTPEISDRITVTGTVNLILCDGATLTANKGITVSSGNTLNIYGQSSGTGTLTATGGTEYIAGIGGRKADSTYNADRSVIHGGTITIHGGTVNATGGTNGDYGGAGIGGADAGVGGAVTIYGGTVTATGGYSGAGIGGGRRGYGGTITIHGGTVTANGGAGGAGIGGGRVAEGNVGSVTINGGTVNATGGEGAAGIGGGYLAGGVDVTINGGIVCATGGDSNGTVGIGRGYDMGHSKPHGKLTLGSGMYLYGGSSDSDAAQVTKGDGDDYARTKYMKVQTPPIAYRAATVDATTHAVSFTDETCTEYTPVTTDTTAWSNGWYVVSSTPEISNRITVTGTVHLILCDGATLTASKGITVAEGNTLNIYGQSSGTGELIANSSDATYAGIGGGLEENGGTVTIHGGTVNATGGQNAAGIGGGRSGNGGTITIHGGTVNANGGQYGAGIGGGYYAGGVDVTINGGIVCATGGNPYDAVGIGKGYPIGDSKPHGKLTLGDGMYLYGGNAADSKAHVPAGQDGSYARSLYMEVNSETPHTHSFTYTGNDGDTITVVCANTDGYCPLPASSEEANDHIATLTIAAPTAESNGAAVLTQKPAGSFTNLPAIQYQTKTGDDWGTPSATAPSGTGFHKASITLTNTDNSTVKAEVTYGLNTITTEADGDPDGCSFTVPAVAAVGAKIKPTFTLATGYEVKSITVTDGENDVSRTVEADTEGFTMPEYSVTVDVTFGKIDYDITIPNAAHGTVTAKKGDAVVTTANYGDTITLTVTPDEDYGVKTVTTGSGTLVQTALDPETGVATYELTMDADNATVTAEFAALTTYTVFYNASGSPDAVSVRPAGDTGNGYSMTSNAKFDDLNCWSTQIRAGAGAGSLSLSVREDSGEWTSLTIPVVESIPNSLTAGTAVALAGETNAFVVAFAWGADTETQSRYYLVTSNTESIDVPNPADTASETFSGWTYLVPASAQGAEGEIVTVNKADSGDSTTVQLANITQTTIVNAIWTPRQYTVSFDPDNGGEKTTQPVTYGSAITQPSTPTKTGYEFVGWVLAKAAVEQVDDETLQFSAGTTFDFENTKIINDLNLKAKWRHVHSYVCLQLDDAVFDGAFNAYDNYKGKLHIKLCTSMDDYTVEAHSFVNGKCACGASIQDNKVTLTQYVGNTEKAIKAIRNSFVSIGAPQKNSSNQTFSKWQYSFNATTKDNGSWTDLTAARNVAFAIPDTMRTRAVYEAEKAELSIRSFRYGDKHIAFQFEYSVPEGYTVVDGGLMWGDNVRMKFWDCTVKSFLGSQYEPSLRDAVSVFGGRTIASKMYNYQTINEPGLATPILKPLKSFGKTGALAVAWQPYTSAAYSEALNTNTTIKGYNQRTYPTYAMGYIICKHGNGYVGFMTNAISATLQNPTASHVAKIFVSG